MTELVGISLPVKDNSKRDQCAHTFIKLYSPDGDKTAGDTAGGDGLLKPCVHGANPHGPPLSPFINTVLKTSLCGQHQLENHGPHKLTQLNNAGSCVVTSKQFQKVRDLLDGNT